MLIGFYAGARTIERESIEWILQNGGKGNALCIAPGAAAEALDSLPGTFDLTLKSRKGFVRMALKHGLVAILI